MRIIDDEGQEIDVAEFVRLLGPINRNQILVVDNRCTFALSEELLEALVEHFGVSAPLVMMVPDVSMIKLLTVIDR